MTISSTNRKAGPYAGNDVATAFPFSFKVFSAADVYAVRANSSGNETDLALTTDYTVSLNADQNANPGGTLTLLAPLATGYSLTITSKLDYLQPTDLTNNGGFYPKVISNALDRLTIFCQQLYEQLSRSLKLAISVPPGVKVTLPVPVPYQVLGWDSTGTEIVNVDPTYATALSSDIYNNSDISKGARLVGWLRKAIGAVGRWVSDKLAEQVSVKDFGAIGNGVATDQTAVAAAVAHCKLTGDRLYWPAGTYLTMDNIPDFHSVRHVGPGVVKRGSVLYYVAPTDTATTTNVIYVATTGAAGNDGLTSSQPMSTIQAAFDALANAGSIIGGTWEINLAAGTYNQFATLDGVQSRSRIRIVGPNASGGTPTAIIDGTGMSATSLQGILLTNGVYAYVKDLKFYNWNGGTGVGSGDASSGLIARYACNVWADNCDFDTCGTGFYGYKSRVYQSGGVVSGCDQGSMAFGNTTASYGYGTATTYNTNNIAITYRDASTGVIENGTYNNNGIGVKCMYGSNTRVSNSVFSGSVTSDVYLYVGGSVFFGTGNTHTAGKKIVGQFAFDLDNASQIYWDGNTNRMNFGELSTPEVRFKFRNILTGGAVGSATQFVFEDNSPQIGLVGNSTSTSIFGLMCGVPSNSSLAAWQYVASDNSWRMRLNSADSYRFTSTFFRPAADNAVTLGAASFRWSTVYAGTGTINTSDAREKQQIRELSEAERAVAIRLKSLVRTFKFNDAVAEKGDKARIHFGVIAQDVKAAFEAEDLVAEDYAILCYDEWAEQKEVVETWDDEFDADGNLLRSAGSQIVEPYRPAGNRYGVRYEELLAFIIGATVNA